MYSVDYCPKGLVIGKQGENEVEKVVVDFSPWAFEFGTGTISARLQRPPYQAMLSGAARRAVPRR